MAKLGGIDREKMEVVMEKGSFSEPTETRDLSGMGTVEVVRLGGITVSRSTFWCPR